MSRVRARRRPKLVRQLNQTECALCCCAILLRSQGSSVTMNDLRLRYTVGRDGLNIAHIAEILRQEGATPHVFAVTADEVIGLREPAICHWNSNHYVVVDPRNNVRIRIVDPGAGVIRLGFQEFSDKFGGYAITIDPHPEPVRRNVPTAFSVLWRLARSHVLLLLITLAVALGSALATLWLPQLLSATFSMDIAGSSSLLWPLSVLAGIALGYALLTLTRSIVSLIAATAVGKSMSQTVFSRMMRLPYGDLAHRGVGDLLFTLDSVQRLRMLITTDFIVVVVGAIMVTTLIIWLTVVSPLAGIVAVGLIVLLVVLALASGRGVRRFSLEETRRRAELQSIQVSAVSGLESIRTNAMEDAYIQRWRTSNNSVQRYSVGLQSIQGVFTALSASMQLVDPHRLDRDCRCVRCC
ncbi:cysteine peptidase family C39 domain-containing protein [Actinomyces wuliandei]|uniref:cysteine peptidase family C39 domain-containing protein n=1 Tax=Actinomyces wuliandei TaxID=2057743 RepID=UPI000FDB010D|nr:cysteine peptidase family C39 domain-containing protein [Actinomyces wuliandei]